MDGDAGTLKKPRAVVFDHIFLYISQRQRPALLLTSLSPDDLHKLISSVPFLLSGLLSSE